MTRRTKALIAACGLTAVLIAGVAYALWSGSGSGSGRARATTAVVATIDPSDGTADLYPGFTGGDLYFTITNSNPYPITFASMTAGAVTVDAGHAAACPAGNVTVAGATGLNLLAPPGTSGQLSIPNVVTMIATAPNGCQGASFDVVLTLTGSQS